jgi:hypothetical protein
VESNLEASCRARESDVIFSLKYHYEHNFIEQCWSFAKRLYRKKDLSSSGGVLERNVVEEPAGYIVRTMNAIESADDEKHQP